MATYEEIKEAMEELDDEALMDMANAIMDEGGADAQTCLKACQDGLAEVGARFESGEYFVGDLVFAGELMGEVMDVIKPALAGGGTEAVGKMILCTVKDDLHDIGKNIVRSMLEAGGMEVVDLGIDVPAQKIIEEAKKNDIKIIGLSGVLTLAVDSMKDTVKAFEEAGMRENVHIIVGGNPLTEDGCKYIGADAWAVLPQDTVRICTEWAVLGKR